MDQGWIMKEGERYIFKSINDITSSLKIFLNMFTKESSI